MRSSRYGYLMRFACTALVACGGGGADNGVGTAPPPSAPPSTPTPATAVNVNDNVFAPAAITTSRATAVTWTWRGSNPHNVTFEDATQSSATQTSGSHQRAFAQAGTYRYRCTIHSSDFASGMVGSVEIP